MSLILSTSNLILRLPDSGDAKILKEFALANQFHFSKWETIHEDLSEEAFEKQISFFVREDEEARAARFLVFEKNHPKTLIALCNFTQIFYGFFKACYLGYKIGKEHEGKGLMFEALERAISYTFQDLGLHRIMANYMPSNLRSKKLLERLGFENEGYAKNYLLINGKWEDHVLTALTCEKWNNRPLA